MITLSAQRPDATRDSHLFARSAEKGEGRGRGTPGGAPHLQEYSHCSSPQLGVFKGAGLQREGGTSSIATPVIPSTPKALLLVFSADSQISNERPKKKKNNLQRRSWKKRNSIPFFFNPGLGSRVDELQGSPERRNNAERNCAATEEISNTVDPSASVADICTDMHFDTTNTACRRGESSTAAVGLARVPNPSNRLKEPASIT